MIEAWIIDACRTPRGIGKPGKGGLTEVHPQRILSTVLKALVERTNIDTAEIDDIIIGCNAQWGKQDDCIGRMAALDAGYSTLAPGFSLERFCGSGLTAVNVAAMGVMSGWQNLVIAGGVESMSYVSTMPRTTHGIVDGDNRHLRMIHPQPHQGVCADVIATLEGITREQTDELAVETQHRAAAAIKGGHFKKSLIAVYYDNGSVALEHDEYPRPNTTLAGLATLKPAFAAMYDHPLDQEGTSYKKLVQQAFPGLRINHIHHAGNSSGVVDGAAAVVIASPDYARRHDLKPRAKIRMATVAGDSPELMLNAPVPATRKALKLAGMAMKDLDLFEINEAFAVVPLKWMRDMDADPEKVNVNGGAMALGHPIGATGAILIGMLLDELERRDLNVGLVTMCTGGGMAPATIIERI